MRAVPHGEGRALVPVSHIEAAYAAAISAVADQHCIPPDRVADASSHAERRCRQLAVYLAHVQGGIAVKRLAKSVGLSPRQIRRSVQAIEDRRDDPQFDATVAVIEEVVACAA